METLIVATHQASGRKQFPSPKKAPNFEARASE